MCIVSARLGLEASTSPATELAWSADQDRNEDEAATRSPRTARNRRHPVHSSSEWNPSMRLGDGPNIPWGVGLQRCAGRAAWQILNAIFTMSKLAKRCSAPSVPRRDERPISHDFGLAVDGAGSGGALLSRARRKQVAGLIGTHRFAEIPALADRAAQRHDGPVSSPRSRCLRRTPAPTERRCELCHRADDGGILPLRREVADEAAVDLDDIERQRAQMRQR